jgi:pyruvate dehydrogenase E2 component (dihydrolipoamide acetyltransferase)
MSKEFKLPELGENIVTAQITKVLVAVGDKIEIDQPVLEIETDKATVEVPSEISGVVNDVKVKDGETAKVGQVIFTVDSADSAKSENKSKVEEPKKEAPKEEIQEEPKKLEASVPKTVTAKSEFKLPDLGENIETAQITKVIVKSGDKIAEDTVVLEIETDKATVEVPAEMTGTVKEVLVKDGDTAKIGQTIFTVDGGSVSASKEKPKLEEQKSESKSTPVVETKSEKKTEPQITQPRPAVASAASLPARKEITNKIAPASPTVRRFAREIGIDVHQVTGTGPGGRISIEDVKAFAKSLNESISKGAVGAGVIGVGREPLPDFSKWGEIERTAMSNVRKKTAEHLSYAWATIPHVTQFDKADITELEVLRKKFSKKVEAAGGKLTVTAILLKVISSALKVFPQFNASVDMENKEIIYKKYYNVGIAVDTEKGLIVPVIKDVDKKNIVQLSVELKELSERARNKKTTLDEMQGGNFSISNLGGIGGTYFTPIVNSPEVAILGVSRSAYEPVYQDGEFVPRLMMPLSLSYDHRVIDGADAIKFLRWVIDALENPFLLSLEG